MLFTHHTWLKYSSLANLKWETPPKEPSFLPCCINHKTEKKTIVIRKLYPGYILKWPYCLGCAQFEQDALTYRDFNTTKFGRLRRHTWYNYYIFLRLANRTYVATYNSGVSSNETVCMEKASAVVSNLWNLTMLGVEVISLCFVRSLQRRRHIAAFIYK